MRKSGWFRQIMIGAAIAAIPKLTEMLIRYLTNKSRSPTKMEEG